MNTQKLSLRSAIFINLNIILGTGIFINSALLCQHMGSWSAITYFVVGLVLLPLIICLAALVTLYKGGSFYDYAAALHPLAGFISQWSYFVGKMAACALGIHTACSLIKVIFIPLQGYSTLYLDTGCILFFCILNMANLRINSSIQMLFFFLKIVPILSIILIGLAFLSPSTLISMPVLPLSSLWVSIPFALYAFTGFEATCSLIHTLNNPGKDGPRAIMYSYLMSVLVAILFQTALYLLIGQQLANTGTFLETFPLLFNTLLSGSASLRYYGIIVAHMAIASSALGASYGIMFSNAWNLYTLAEKRLLPGARAALWLTASGVPFVCICIEAAIGLIYIWYSQGDQVILQQVNTLALTATFSLSVIGLAWHQLKHHRRVPLITLCGGMSCFLLILFLTKNIIYFHKMPMLPFIVLIVLGLIGFLANFKKHQRA